MGVEYDPNELQEPYFNNYDEIKQVFAVNEAIK